MKNVTRPQIPASLATNAARWTRELQRWVQANPTAAVPDNLIKHYKQDDVREALQKMYRDQCCYCEGRITDVSYGHIEHRQPKSRYPSKAFDWHNLHLACPKCNTKKGDKWSQTDPILDAVVDRPVEKHLTYRTGMIGVLRSPRSARGKTTVEHADLNRDGLPGTRTRIYLAALQTIRELKGNLSAPDAGVVRQELEKKKEDEYGSVIAFALEEAGL